MQLKHQKNINSKSLGQEGEASKANPPPPSQVSHKSQFLFVCSWTCKILGVGVMLGPRYDHFYDGYYTLYVHVCFSYFKGAF
jgi:hypothetical protein